MLFNSPLTTGLIVCGLTPGVLHFVASWRLLKYTLFGKRYPLMVFDDINLLVFNKNPKVAAQFNSMMSMSLSSLANVLFLTSDSRSVQVMRNISGLRDLLPAYTILYDP